MNHYNRKPLRRLTPLFWWTVTLISPLFIWTCHNVPIPEMNEENKASWLAFGVVLLRTIVWLLPFILGSGLLWETFHLSRRVRETLNEPYSMYGGSMPGYTHRTNPEFTFVLLSGLFGVVCGGIAIFLSCGICYTLMRGFDGDPSNHVFTWTANIFRIAPYIAAPAATYLMVRIARNGPELDTHLEQTSQRREEDWADEMRRRKAAKRAEEVSRRKDSEEKKNSEERQEKNETDLRWEWINWSQRRYSEEIDTLKRKCTKAIQTDWESRARAAGLAELSNRNPEDDNLVEHCVRMQRPTASLLETKSRENWISLKQYQDTVLDLVESQRSEGNFDNDGRYRPFAVRKDQESTIGQLLGHIKFPFIDAGSVLDDRVEMVRFFGQRLTDQQSLKSRFSHVVDEHVLSKSDFDSILSTLLKIENRDEYNHRFQEVLRSLEGLGRQIDGRLTTEEQTFIESDPIGDQKAKRQRIEQEVRADAALMQVPPDEAMIQQTIATLMQQ